MKVKTSNLQINLTNFKEKSMIKIMRKSKFKSKKNKILFKKKLFHNNLK